MRMEILPSKMDFSPSEPMGVDHRKELCRFKAANPTSQTAQSSTPPPATHPTVSSESILTAPTDDNGNLQQPGVEDGAKDFGPWMLVQKKTRRPNAHKKAQSYETRPHRNKFAELGSSSLQEEETTRGKKTTRSGHEKEASQSNPTSKPILHTLKSPSPSTGPETPSILLSPELHANSLTITNPPATSSQGLVSSTPAKLPTPFSPEHPTPLPSDLIPSEILMEDLPEHSFNPPTPHPLTTNHSSSLGNGTSRIRKPPDPGTTHDDRGDNTTKELNTQDGGQYLSAFRTRTEALHRVDTIWWIEQLRLTIEPGWSTISGPPIHSFQMASMRTVTQDHRRIRSILPGLVSDPLPNYPSMNSMKLLIWNCRGAGNNTFKRNLRELLRTHKPEILVLMETKVSFSSLGNFFNNLGFSASTVVDPIGRMGGI
ncbi:hypothetical protein LOK49_LG07G02768 [Camellia lanceoleosa]|uniref:Uncharacterized protein n=1 Tax=Camellia lanceoleosa TaxID=1840588 RepID=A0ACC0H2R4_9ERIC|nr:hypothetical protein LOK49_LG07G02768 [Camellia lanceoleosa]